MRVEELFEKLSKFVVKDSIVWLSIEEARYWGLNRIYYTLAVEPELRLGVVAFDYVVSIDEVIPIALALEFNPEDASRIPLDKVTRAVREVGGYIYSYENTFGVVIPVNEWDVEEVLGVKGPKIIKEILGIDKKLIIDGYFLDLAR